MKFSWLLFLLGCFLTVNAQRFNGGTGSGYHSFSAESFIAGGNPNAKYLGAGGNGFHSQSTEVFISGANANARYLGGTGNGYALGIVNGIFSGGGNANARYLGGVGNGYGSQPGVDVLMNGGNSGIRYIGGTGNGYASNSGVDQFVNGGNSSVRYLGGSGSGYTVQSGTDLFINGGNPNVRFTGGAGNGYAAFISENLYGGNISVRYTGGNGSGYHLAMTETFTSGGDPNVRFKGGTGNGYHQNEGTITLTLPVVLIQFDAVLINRKVELTWATAQESDNRMFEVQRSVNRNETVTVAEVKGSERSSVIIHYHIVDEKPLPDVSYYRLKQTDNDGTITYSNWVAVRNELKGSEIFHVSPNPNNGSFDVTYVEGFRELVLFDMNGKIINHYSGIMLNHYSLEGVPSGIYVLTLILDNGNTKSAKVSVY